jgi:hypothetical protein
MHKSVAKLSNFCLTAKKIFIFFTISQKNTCSIGKKAVTLHPLFKGCPHGAG